MSEIRAKAWKELSSSSVMVVEAGSLAGDLLLAHVQMEFILFVAADACVARTPAQVAHDAAHMLLGTRRCGDNCAELSAICRGWLLDVLPLFDLSGVAPDVSEKGAGGT
jgi:hypothetical protein